MKQVIVAGASGLIGSKLINLLVNHSEIREVIALVRTPVDLNHAKLRQLQVNFDALEDYQGNLKGDAIYCCLGSTKKKTPNLDDYRKVDHDYPVALGKLTIKNGIGQFHLVSALGADSNSSVFYTRLKGETEKDLKALDLQSLHIYQPALLTGNRREHRTFEKLSIAIMAVLNPLLTGPLKKYKSIKATTVAQSMINQTFKNLEGINVYPSNVIQQLA